MVKNNNDKKQKVTNILGRKMDWNDADDVREYNEVRNKRYREEHKNGIRKYLEKNKVKIAIRNKKYKEKHKERLKIIEKKYCENNKDRIKIRVKKYREENKEKVKIQNKKYNEKRKKKECIICGKPAPDKYCTTKCMGIGQSGENSIRWKGGQKDYPSSWTLIFKKSIRDRDNNKCMRCGRPREVFNRALCVHHIDADRMNTTLENCISLCDVCHRLTIGREEFFAEGFRNMLRRFYRSSYEKTNLKIIEKEVKKR